MLVSYRFPFLYVLYFSDGSHIYTFSFSLVFCSCTFKHFLFFPSRSFTFNFSSFVTGSFVYSFLHTVRSFLLPSSNAHVHIRKILAFVSSHNYFSISSPRFLIHFFSLFTHIVYVFILSFFSLRV